jgi:carboxypeptidase T
MKLLFTLFLSLLLLSSAFSQNYKQVRIYLNSSDDMELLVKAGLEFDHVEVNKDKSIVVFLNEVEYSQLIMTNFKHDVLIEDWAKYFATIPDITEEEYSAQRSNMRFIDNVQGFTLGSHKGNYTVTELIAKLDTLRMLYPNLITAKTSIGTTHENRPIYMVKISDNPDLVENEPRVLYTAMHHAREPVSMMQMFYFMYYLLENYATNPSVKYLVDNRELYFIPCLNPDGYQHNITTSPAGGGMWRKNRRNNGTTFGVDLNRNYGPESYWNAPNGGSSTTPSSDTYRGTAPFSEPETEALRNFLVGKGFKNALNYHTYSNLLIYPYGALGKETPDSLLFREYATDMTRYNNYLAGTDLQTVNYSTRGNSDDYFYDGDIPFTGNKIFAMTPEVGTSSDGFWPQPARIIPLCQENIHPNLYYAWVAGGYVVTKNVITQPQYFGPGDIVGVWPRLFNKGLGTAYNIGTDLISLSPYATIFDGTFALEEIPARSDTLTRFPFGVNIAANTPLESKLKFIVINKSGTVELSRDTITLNVGIPAYTFFDSSASITDHWNVTASPSNPKWENTTSTFFSSPSSYTDSKDGQYANNATVTLQSKVPINLAGMQNPYLTFRTRWEIETQWDCGVVMASTNNGSSWIALQGQFTKPASGSGKQTPAGMPMYDGVRNEWVREEISLAPYSGQQILLKFELRSDVTITKDGWYIDDIGVFYYSAVPVELTSFTHSVGKNDITLNWGTASELNNSHFELEKAQFVEGDVADIKNWSTAGIVKGAGTTTETRSYSFVDDSPIIGKSIYRLKQVDFDGTFRYYYTGEAEFNGVTTYALNQNYPNPFNPVTVISFELPLTGNVSIKVYNSLGEEVTTLINGVIEAGRHKVEFNGAGLPSGLYLYKLTAGENQIVKKMMLIK